MPVRTIAVVGAGTMGNGIAQVAGVAGLGVTLIDVNDAAVQKGLDTVRSNLARIVARGKATEADKEAALGLLRGTTALDDVASADLVIEAATENFELKVNLLKRISALVAAETIVASNTSSISITKLASVVSHPDRFIGMHFFNPVPIMPLVEIVRGLQTRDTTHDTIEALASTLGKKPITVKSAPGFVVNRILLPMINEAFFVLAEGNASATEIDEGMKLGCNHPIGPLALADLVGLDVVLAVMQTIHDDFADSKYRPCPLLREMVAAGYLGRKTGRGVYRY
ncbi:MAG: 3-hydroxybutyryl-CoA dehydrogenase [Alphaproteobacteria bacterium]|nr:3-hydroxybutyryl-CoA dehydrogenase [Alphaproteobacteria bacterium]